MPGTYYAAVEDDPLTSGPGGRVVALSSAGTIQGTDGKQRRLAYIGDEAYCSECNSTGPITYGSGLSEQRRLIDFVHGGRRQAVGGDIVLCKCTHHPAIIAVYGRGWAIHDDAKEAPRPLTSDSALSPAYDEQFALCDGAGQPLAGIRYRVRIGRDVVANGGTDTQGRTQRINTQDMQRLTLELGGDG